MYHCGWCTKVPKQFFVFEFSLQMAKKAIFELLHISDINFGVRVPSYDLQLRHTSYTERGVWCNFYSVRTHTILHHHVTKSFELCIFNNCSYRRDIGLLCLLGMVTTRQIYPMDHSWNNCISGFCHCSN